MKKKSMKSYPYPVEKELFSWAGDIKTMVSPIDEIKHNKKFLHASIVAIDPNTGQIKTWVGGINHKHFKFDHIKQGSRQSGSAFKGILYAAAIESGFLPTDIVVDAPVTFQLPTDPYSWTPRNWNKKYTGKKITLRKAFAQSINSVSAYIIKQLGPEIIVDIAKRMGIKSHMSADPSICLGVYDIPVLELTSAYTTFLNDGIWIEPHFITKIEDANGKILEIFKPKKREAISKTTADTMLHMLMGTTEEEGATSFRLRSGLKEDNELAGKTGTSQNQSDGWYIGLSKGLCVGVWVGGEDRCIHFREIRYGSGAHMARPIWEKFLLALYSDENSQYKKGKIKN